MVGGTSRALTRTMQLAPRLGTRGQLAVPPKFVHGLGWQASGRALARAASGALRGHYWTAAATAGVGTQARRARAAGDAVQEAARRQPHLAGQVVVRPAEDPQHGVHAQRVQRRPEHPRALDAGGALEDVP